MQEKKKNINKDDLSEYIMRRTLWNMILMGVAGGISITAGIWAFTILPAQDIRYLALIPIVMGIVSIFYARYG